MFHNKWSIIMDFMFLEIKWYPSNIGNFNNYDNYDNYNNYDNYDN